MGEVYDQEFLEKARATRARNQYIIFGALVAASILLLVGIGAVAYAQEQEARKNTLVFVYQDRVGDCVSIVAYQKGFFAAEGLNIESRVYSSGPACTEALTMGGGNIGTMGDTTGIILTTTNDAYSLLCSHGGGEDRHRIIVGEDSGIYSPADLEGKRIAVKFGTSTHGGLLLFASENGLDLTDELKDMKPSDQLTALDSGVVDAIVASEPTPSQAEALGGARELSTLGGLDNSFPLLLTVNKAWGEDHQDEVVAFLRAMKKAADFIRDNPDEAAQLVADVSSTDVEVIKTAMANHYLELRLDDELVSSLNNMAGFLKDQDKIDQAEDMNGNIDRTYWNKAF